MVEMMNRADATSDGVGADAVLGVHDVGVGGVELFTHRGDRPHDPVGDGLVLAIGKRDETHRDRRIHGSEESLVAAPRQRPHRHLGALIGQCLGEIEGVDHPATRLGRIGQERDAHGVRHLRISVLLGNR